MIWIDDWDQPLTRDGGNNRDRVAEGGIVQWSPSRDYDEDVHHRAKEKLREIAQQDDPDPFFLYVSFTHPHDPYQTTQDYWDRYEGVDIELPGHWNQPPSGQSTMSQWIQAHHDLSDPVTEEDALTCRRAYYGNCSYIDDKVGELVAELERQGLRENTIVFFASDHGEMLGEHGMWSKRSFYEGSANVPLIINFPGGANAGRTVDSVVGLLDVYPTLLEIAGAEIPDDIDGQSLLSLAAGESRGRDEAFCEYYADGVLAPCRSLRQGNLKFNYTHGEKHELFDLETDPQEMNDLIDSPEHAEIRGRMLARVQEGWNGADIDRRVRESQKRRRFIAEVRLKNGAPWQYETPAGKPRELRKGAGIGCGAPLKGQSKG
jgi:choline-sulfatase